VAGQQFLDALYQHPFFEVIALAASSRSAGKTYREAITMPSGQVAWYVDAPDALDRYGAMPVVDAAELKLDGLDVVFSAVETDAARALEAGYAERIPVVSTASAYRYESDVPVLIPAVNGDHAELVRAQKQRGWRGYVVPIPNCTTTGLAIALAPLHRVFGIERVVVTSMQAVSGAGRSPGVISFDVVDNIIPYIPREEEKVAKETCKLLGTLGEATIAPADIAVSATCTRVAVLDGHTESVNVALKRAASIDEVKAAMRAFGKDINPGTHPSAPTDWLRVLDDPFRPQPRTDRDVDGGMATTVGRIRPDSVIGEHGIKFMLVSHNTKMGAAKGAILVAEDLKTRGLLG
ncbi:MAG: aspartate-semialdehyde dehydrogenase, partial [Myxococcota bacterium]